MEIAAKTARYIRLGNKSLEISTLDRGNIHLQATAVTDELALEGDLGRIEQHLIQQGYSQEAASSGALEAKDFYNLGADCLWITFARGHLWWTFADPEVVWIMNDLVMTDRRVRTSISGWSNTDVGGAPIKIDDVSDAIKRLEHLERTGPDATTLQELLQLINGEASAEDSAGQLAEAATRANQSPKNRPPHFEVPSTFFTVTDVIRTPSAAPDEGGVYAWWFDELPNVPTEGAREQDGFRLAYVGIASARPGSRRTLRRRLRNHCNGPIATSTLRRSLAAVLIHTLDLHPSVAPNNKVKIPDDEEARLSDWLSKHGRVAWTVNSEPWVYEAELLKNGPQLALNIAGNCHEFTSKLRALRRQLKAPIC
jgi:hypothetical protein